VTYIIVLNIFTSFTIKYSSIHFCDLNLKRSLFLYLPIVDLTFSYLVGFDCFHNKPFEYLDYPFIVITLATFFKDSFAIVVMIAVAIALIIIPIAGVIAAEHVIIVNS